MNYIKEINAFYDAIERNPLSASAVTLWHALMHINNKAMWAASFTVAAPVLRLKSGLTESSFKRARTELNEKGYIAYESRGNGKAPSYRMMSLLPEAGYDAAKTACEAERTPDLNGGKHADGMPAQCVNQSKDRMTDVDVSQPVNHEADHSTDHIAACCADHSTAPLTKQYINQTKTKHKPTTTTTGAIRFYQENIGVASAYITSDISSWIDEMGNPLVLDALKRAVEQGKPTWRYTKGILKAWKTKGVTTVERAEAEDRVYRNGSKAEWPVGRGEVVPDWFKERKAKRAPGQEQVSKTQAPAAEDPKVFNQLLSEFTTGKQVGS